MAMGEADGFSSSFAEEIKFCPPCFSASCRPDINDRRTMKREDSLDTFVADHPADDKGLVYAPAFAGNYCAGEYLNTLFAAFFNTAADIHHITHLKVRNSFPERFAFNGIQHFCFCHFRCFSFFCHIPALSTCYRTSNKPSQLSLYIATFDSIHESKRLIYPVFSERQALFEKKTTAKDRYCRCRCVSFHNKTYGHFGRIIRRVSRCR